MDSRLLVFAPATAAAVIPGAVAAGFYRAYGATDNLAVLWIIASIVAALHVFVLGMPGALALYRLRLLNGWSLLLLGFVAGCVPSGLLAWLSRSDHLLNHEHDVRAVLFCGACGALGAFAATVTYTAMRSNNRWRVP